MNDSRYMALSDITNAIKQDPSTFVGDEAVENRVLQNVLLLIEDKISEVKNQAVKWYVMSSSIVDGVADCVG